MLQALTCYDLASWIGWQLAQRDGQPDPGFATGLIPPYLPARTRDGHWIQMANLTVNTLWNFLDVTGLTHLMEDPSLQGYAELHRRRGQVGGATAVP